MEDAVINQDSESKELALHYMITLIDVARECFVILDSNLIVLSANPLFYSTFQTTKEQSENKILYNLGNGQWNIPELKTLLNEILPQRKIVNNYEVFYDFPKIGQKTMLLNAKQIDSVQLIILAIEDITERKNLEKKLAEYTKGLEDKIETRTVELSQKNDDLERMNKVMVGCELKMIEQKKEITELKKNQKV